MKKLTRKVVATILTAAMAMSVGMPAFAENSNEDNVEYLSIPIFATLEVNGLDLFKEEMDVRLDESATVLEKGREVLEAVLEYQDKGGFVTWNEMGVELVVKELYPDLYGEIKGNFVTSNEISITVDKLSNKTVRGNAGDEFEYIHRGLVNEKLYGIRVTINWAWDDSTKVLTTILPSSSANSYDLLWDPVGNGINKSNGYYNSGKTKYYHTTEGIFAMIHENIDVFAYPYVKVELSADGGVIVDSGIR